MKMTKRSVLYKVPKIRVRCISGHKCIYIHKRKFKFDVKLILNDLEVEVCNIDKVSSSNKSLQKLCILMDISDCESWHTFSIISVPFSHFDPNIVYTF